MKFEILEKWSDLNPKNNGPADPKTSMSQKIKGLSSVFCFKNLVQEIF